MPALPDGLTARPMRRDDVAAIVDLLAAAEPLDATGEHEDADDLTEWFVNDRVDLAEDTLVVETAGGALVAWASAIDLGNHRDAYSVRLDGRVHPAWRRRGIGSALQHWQLAHARRLHVSRAPDMPARFAVTVPAAMESLCRLAEQAGAEPVQFYVEMDRPLADLPAPRYVDGVELVPFDWARDDEVRRAHNVAFREHAGTAERDAHAWQSWFTGQRSFRPDVSRLALADGAVIGYALGYEYAADTAATGLRVVWLGQIGVLPTARGRGVASAVLGAALHAAAVDGAERAALQVDTENTTGALRLYESLGFRTRRRETVWAVRVPSVG